MNILMLKDTPVMKFDISEGFYGVLDKSKMPYGLNISLEQSPSFKTMLSNNGEMTRWCAGRTLPMSQKHAKKIRNLLGFSQDDDDMTRSQIALAYRCLTLDDSYWVKREEEPLVWKEVNLFQNKSSNVLTPVSLRGDVSTVFEGKLKNSSDLGVDGSFAKSWVRDTSGQLYLLKTDYQTPSDETIREVCASKVLDCFDIPHAIYELTDYHGVRVSKSRLFTDENHALVKFKEYKRYCYHHNLSPLASIKEMFPIEYDRLCIATYLIGNEDLHDGNWGLIRDSNTGDLLSFAPLYDFNYAFTIGYPDGVGKMPFKPETIFIDKNGKELSSGQLPPDMSYTQKRVSLEDYAKEAYTRSGFPQIQEVTPELFPDESYFVEFQRRCAVLGLPLQINTPMGFSITTHPII